MDPQNPNVVACNELGKHKDLRNTGSKILASANYVEKHLDEIVGLSDELKQTVKSGTYDLGIVSAAAEVLQTHKPAIQMPQALRCIEEPLNECIRYLATDEHINMLKTESVTDVTNL